MMMMSTHGAATTGRSTAVGLMMLAGITSACSGGDGVAGSDKVASIEVTPASTVVSVGTVMPLNVQLRDESGQLVRTQGVFWSSSDTAIATVSTVGVVTAKSSGDVQIAASAQGVSAISNIRVANAPPGSQGAVTRVVISPSSAVVKSGGAATFRQVQLGATAYDAGNRVVTGQSFTWTSSKSSVASVNASGLVTGSSAGTVTISAATAGKTGTASIQVVK